LVLFYMIEDGVLLEKPFHPREYGNDSK